MGGNGWWQLVDGKPRRPTDATAYIQGGARARIRPHGEHQRAAPATQITAAQRRRPSNARATRAKPGRTSDPLENTKVLHLPRKSQRRSGDPATPGRASDPMERDWLLAIGGWQLVGGNWLVTIGGWQLVDDNWLMTIGW